MAGIYGHSHPARHRAVTVGLVVILSLLLSLLCARALGAFPGDSAVVSDFSHGAEGWTVRGPAMGPTWEPNDGHPPASLMAVGLDPAMPWYWRAPAKFLGDRADAYGRTLQYEVKLPESSSGSPDPAVGDVVLRGAGITLLWNDRGMAVPGWNVRIVPLTESAGWQKRAGSMRAPASRADMKAVLASLESLEIRGGSGETPAPSYLDSVSLNAPFWASAASAGLMGLLATAAVGLVLGRRRIVRR